MAAQHFFPAFVHKSETAHRIPATPNPLIDPRAALMSESRQLPIAP